MTSSTPVRWLVLEIPRPIDDVWGEEVVEALVGYAGGVEERPGLLLVYLPDPEKGENEIVEEVNALLHAVAESYVKSPSSLGAIGSHGDSPVDPAADTARVGHPLQVSAYRWQLHEEWGEIWRKGFTPRRITPRLVVSPTWESPLLESGEILLSLDPGMAFGTAEHPTTRGSLRLLDPLITPGEKVADIGAGSGILSIAAALLGAKRILAVEMDSWSCAAARENALLNRVADRIEVREERVGPELIPGEAPFDGLLANIESGILLPLLPSFARDVREGGWIVLSGILRTEAAGIVDAAEEVGLLLIDQDQEEEWWTGSFRRGSTDPVERNEDSPLA